MIIKNVSAKTSALYIWFALILLLLFLFMSIIILYDSLDFTNIYSIPLQILILGKDLIIAEGDLYSKFMIALLIYILPTIFFVWLIRSIISRNGALKEFSQKLNLVSVDFRDNCIAFNFNQHNCNFSCSYRDINYIKVVINIIRVRTKNGESNCLNNISIKFGVLNNKSFTCEMSLMLISPLKKLYKIIDYTREVKDFSYEFTGDGDPFELKERLDCYKEKGMKPILTKNQESNMKCISIVFFGLGIFFMFAFCSGIHITDTAELIVPGIFIIISFICDICLIIDKIHEKRYEGIKTWKEHHSKNELKI